MSRLAVAATILGAVTVAITPMIRMLPLIAAVGCVAGLSRVTWQVLAGTAARHADRAARSISVAMVCLSWALTTLVPLLAAGIVVDRLSLPFGFYLVGAFVAVCSGLLWVRAGERPA